MIKEKIIQIKANLKELTKNQNVIDDLDYLTFLGTLIPVPIYQEAAQLVNKFVSNHKLNTLMSEVRNDIYKANTRIEKIESDEEKIQAIANTVNMIPELKEKVDSILENAQEEFPSEFRMETENSSTQTIIDKIIDAKFTSISAVDNSHNRLDNVEINSPITHLRAVNNSSNYLKGTDFKDHPGYVGMDGITQKGDVQVTGNSLSFGKEATIIFGNENEITGECPVCNETVYADKKEIQSYTHIKCLHCLNKFKIILN